MDPTTGHQLDRPEPLAGSTPAVAPQPRRGPRVVVGSVLVLAGLVAGGIAVRSAMTDDAPAAVDRSVGSEPETTDPATGPAPAGDPTEPRAGTTRPAWPLAVQGRPAAFGNDGDDPPPSVEGLDDGWYLWSDFSGWHLWLVGGGDGSVEVTTNASFLSEAVGDGPLLDAGDQRLVLARGDAVATVVGVDFNPGFFAKELVVTVTGDLPLRTGSAPVDATSPLVLRFEPQG